MKIKDAKKPCKISLFLPIPPSLPFSCPGLEQVLPAGSLFKTKTRGWSNQEGKCHAALLGVGSHKNKPVGVGLCICGVLVSQRHMLGLRFVDGAGSQCGEVCFSLIDKNLTGFQ